MRNSNVQKQNRPRRGIALLLVMIGLVVCSILTAGFLATQGTSIGIARNERDSEQARAIAQSGLDLCFQLVKTKSNWRTTMSPGTWINNVTVGDGTVTVTAADAAGNSSFTTDNTQGVVFTSVGTCNGRTFKLTGTISPTGGGTVFRGGNFMQGAIVLGNTDLLSAATIDSYNSTLGAYGGSNVGSNAAFWSNATSNVLTVYYPSSYKGSLLAGPNSLLGSVVNLLGSLLGLGSGPSTTSAATEPRTPGTTVAPNTAGMAAATADLVRNTSGSITTPGAYQKFTMSGGSPGTDNVTIASGFYHFTSDMSIGTGGVLQVGTSNVVFLVDGNTSIAGKITVSNGGSMTIYTSGSFTVNNGQVNSGADPSRFIVMGLSNGSAVTVSGSSGVLSGAIFAPQSSVVMQNASKTSGGIIAHDLTVKNTAQFHYDENIVNLKISAVTGGSAPPGTADYRVNVASSN